MFMATFINRYPALRSASIVFGAVFAWSIIVAAALAAALIVQNERRSAPAAVPPANASIHGNGLLVLSPLDDAQAFNETVGFKPVVPDALPDLADTSPLFFAVRADDGSLAEGQVRFAERTGASRDGIRGLAIALIERARASGDATDGTVATAVVHTTRIFTSELRCGDVAVTAQLYFYSNEAEQPPPAAASSPVAQAFLASLRDQCARR